MATDNETVEEIVREMREWRGGGTVKVFMVEMADRIEAAHKREMNHRALIAGVSLADAVDEAHKRELAAKDDERLTIVANYEHIIAAKDAEIVELRECLKEAVDYNCALCKSKGKACEVEGFCAEHRWRKVLEGGAK